MTLLFSHVKVPDGMPDITFRHRAVVYTVLLCEVCVIGLPCMCQIPDLILLLNTTAAVNTTTADTFITTTNATSTNTATTTTSTMVTNTASTITFATFTNAAITDISTSTTNDC